jgi:endonuclease/exonuclease/phosphatase (EEP) superfamily protein YafD
MTSAPWLTRHSPGKTGRQDPLSRLWHRVRVKIPSWARLRRADEPWWRVLLTVAALAAVAATLVALGLHEFEWSWQWTLVLAALSHYLMWAAPIGLGCALVVRRWILLSVAGVVLVLVLLVQVPPNIADGFAVSGAPTNVLQANLHVGAADPGTVVRLVRDHHVQLLATEELTDAEQGRLVAAGLPRLLPYRFSATLPNGGGGLAIWSRYPLRMEHNLPGYELGVLTAQVERPGAPFTAVAVHLLPPYPYPSGEWRTEIAHLHTMLDGLAAAQVIVAGDFNATVDHAQFRALLDHGYADAAEQSGSGYLPTYPNDRWYGPVIGIDHVLSRGLHAGSVRTFDLPGSDHRALLAQLYR